MDGREEETLREEDTPSLAYSAGVDTTRRELVLKLVNGAERERTLQLRGLPLSRQWKGEILTADSLMAENTLDQPNLVAPRALAGAGGELCNFAAAVAGGGAHPTHSRGNEARVGSLRESPYCREERGGEIDCLTVASHGVR